MYCPKCGFKNLDDAKFCSGCGSQLGVEHIVTEEKTSVSYAGFWRRYGASIIDSFILSPIYLTVHSILLVISGSSLGAQESVPPILWVSFIIGLVLNWLYFTLFESSSEQATLGKMVFRIIVTDLNGNRISFGRANGRYWAKILSGLSIGIGYLMTGFSEKKQALHDIH